MRAVKGNTYIFEDREGWFKFRVTGFKDGFTCVICTASGYPRWRAKQTSEWFPLEFDYRIKSLKEDTIKRILRKIDRL